VNRSMCQRIPSLLARHYTLLIPWLVWVAVLLILVQISSPAFALDPKKTFSQYSHDVWQTEDGLPHSSINVILQTADGYLWLGTYEGLARFDGVDFKVFSHKNNEGLLNDHINALFEDQHGALWIGTDGGLTRLKGGEFFTYTTKEGLLSDHVNALFEDQHGALWIGTHKGLHQLKNGNFTAYTTNEGLSNDLVWCLYEDHKGNLWIGTNSGGLNRLEDGKFTAYGKEEGLSNEAVRAIYEDREEDLWIGTSGGGLSRLKDGKFVTYTTEEGLSNDLVRAIYQDRDGTLWIGSSGGGLSRFYKGEFSTFTTKDGLSNDVVWSIYEDREGNLWIGTAGGGLNRLKEGKFTTYTTQEGLSSNFVWSICEDRRGGFWLGTNGGGLNLFKDGDFKAYTTNDGLSSNIVRSLYQDSKGNLWVGTGGGGVNRFREGEFISYTTKEGLSDDVVYAICEDREGALWFGTSEGLNRLEDGKFTTYTTHEGLADDVVHYLHEDRNGNLWIATNRGLSRFKDGTFTTYTTENGLSHRRVLAVYEDDDGILWIGTRGGLNLMRDGNITAIKKEDGLFDDRIFQILEDGQGNLWMSCNKGVFRVSRKELIDFAEGEARDVTSFAYGKTDGLKSSECNGGNQSAGYKAHDGSLWFPTMKGIAMIDPENIVINTNPPLVTIEKVLVDNTAIDFHGKEVSLPPGSKKFEFHYTALSFAAPEKVKFGYRLEGFEADWVNAETRRTAYYTNLGPGAYHFHVIACNNDGIWNETGANCAFHIDPRFYQTPLFYVLFAMSAVLLGIGVYHLRVRQLKAREVELESIVQERTSQLREANNKLERLATLDGLTGVSNRRHFDEFLDQEWKRAIRYQAPVSLIMIDIDFFKMFNDTYGHQAGDECLKQVANVLQETVPRATDLVARYGGEEFSVVLTNTDTSASANMAEKLRSGVERLKIPHKRSKAGDHVTISLGVATGVPHKKSAPESLIAAADKALYQAKEEGRNQVIPSGVIDPRLP